MLHATGCFVYCSNVMVENTKIDKTRNDGWPLSVGFCRQSLRKSLPCVPSAHAVLGRGWPPPASRAPAPYRCWARPAHRPARPTQPHQRIQRRPLGCVMHALEGATRAGTHVFGFADVRQDEVCPLTLGWYAVPLGLHGTAGFDKLSNTPATLGLGWEARVGLCAHWLGLGVRFSLRAH